MRISAKIILCLISFFILYSCSNEKDFPNTPHIEVRDFREQFIVTGSDTEKVAIWTIGFTDGDGDIGVRDTNDKDNFIVTISYIEDDILNQIEGRSFRIPIVQNIRTDKGIEGSFEFRIETALFALEDSFPTDSLMYSGFVVDRAGNESNTVVTPIFSAD